MSLGSLVGCESRLSGRGLVFADKAAQQSAPMKRTQLRSGRLWRAPRCDVSRLLRDPTPIGVARDPREMTRLVPSSMKKDVKASQQGGVDRAS